MESIARIICCVCDKDVLDEKTGFMWQKSPSDTKICISCWTENTKHLEQYETLTGWEKDKCCLPDCPEENLLCFNVYRMQPAKMGYMSVWRVAFCSKCYDKEIALY